MLGFGLARSSLFCNPAIPSILAGRTKNSGPENKWKRLFLLVVQLGEGVELAYQDSECGAHIRGLWDLLWTWIWMAMSLASKGLALQDWILLLLLFPTSAPCLTSSSPCFAIYVKTLGPFSICSLGPQLQLSSPLDSFLKASRVPTYKHSEVDRVWGIEGTY